MTAEKKERIIRIVTNLLQKTMDRGATEEEAEAASEKAGNLLAEYGLTIEDLATVDEAMTHMIDQVIFGMTAHRQVWESLLGNACAKAFDCYMLYTPQNHTRDGRWRMNVLGMKKDVELVSHFFSYLRRSVSRRTSIYKEEYKRELYRDGYRNGHEVGGLVKNAGTNYARGMVNTLWNRLMEINRYQKKAAEATNCMDLVVVKDKAVNDFINQQYPNRQKSSTQRPKGNWLAYKQGQADGKDIALSRPLAGAKDRQRLR